MSMQDPLSDMLTSHPQRPPQRSKVAVTMPCSKMKVSVAQVLEGEGYITGYSVTEGVKPELTVDLKYYEGKPVIEEIARVSRPGLRKYAGSNDLPSIRRRSGYRHHLHLQWCDERS